MSHASIPSPFVIPLVCGNWSDEAETCGKAGKFCCGNCHLVMYCGRKCQKDHWSIHKKDCKGTLASKGWRPAWEREDRDPAWALPAASRHGHNPFGGNKYFWGNTSAIDIMGLERNEGLSYRDNIFLLFAASGDLRNVVQTIVGLPGTLPQVIQITINDFEFEVVARNAILLLFLLDALDETSPADTVGIDEIAESWIHLWCSAFLPFKLSSMFRNRFDHLVADVRTHVMDDIVSANISKTWKFKSGRTLRLTLQKGDWIRLIHYFDMPEGLSEKGAKDIRAAVVLAPERADYRDRWYFKDATPFARVAKQRFREDGLLLPFGHPRTGFDAPNLSLFRTAETWPMDDKSDPLTGWPLWEVHRWKSPASEDCYGKLFAYLRSKFRSLCNRLRSLSVNFEMYCLDATELPGYLMKDSFARIEVANICDAGYVGIRTTMTRLSPLLQPSRSNPHATMITLFINAVMEMVHRYGQRDTMPNMELLMEYLPNPNVIALMQPNNADMLRMWDARTLVMDVDKYFEEYMKSHRLHGLPAIAGALAKEENSIIEPWPMQLKLRPGQSGSQEEFNLLLGSNFSGLERYIEWKREEPGAPIAL